MAKKSQRSLGARERQIMDAVHQLGEGSVAEVRELLPDAPGYSSVRTMMRLLEEKGFLKHRQDGIRYVYRSALHLERERKSALRHLLDTFFRGAPSDAMAAMLDLNSGELSSEDLDRLAGLIDEARRQKDIE